LNKIVWAWEEINEWLPIYDAVYSHLLSPENSAVLEIGTWKGGWAIFMAENDRSRKIVCIDPYPNLAHIKDIFLEIAQRRAKNQIVLFERVEQALAKKFQSFDVIHLDGEHSQEAVERDLKSTAPLLNPNGLYIIDDLFYHSFPGVTAATFQFIDKLELSPFLFSEKKLYLCKKSHYEQYYTKARQMLNELELMFEEDQLLTGQTSSYLQRNSINGFSILIPKIYSSPTSEFLRNIGIKRKRSPKSIALYLAPPALVDLAKKFYLSLGQFISRFRGQPLRHFR